MDEPEQRTGLHCPIGDHQVLLSFVNDADAQEFRDWWALEGWGAFKAWDDSGKYMNGDANQ